MLRPQHRYFIQVSALIFIGLLILSFSSTFVNDTPSVYALPEYSEQTGEPCATCHVSPGGGGPRTLRGMLWAAQGHSDDIPILVDVLIAPGVDDPLVLYDAACAACHGYQGEGLFGGALVGTGVTEAKIRSTTLRGKVRSGMPSFEGQFTEHQLDILVEYVAQITSGAIVPPNSYPLPPAEFGCTTNEDTGVSSCGGN